MRRSTLSLPVLLIELAIATPASAQLVLDLDPSLHNGFNVSCNAGQDGAIDLSIIGGTPPYAIEWSTGATIEDLANLPAGYYRVGVTDGVGAFKEAEITLTEPEKLTAELAPFEWGNGYNVSCFQCYNGSIDLTVTGGVGPYAYAWSDGATTQDRSSLGSDNYHVNITDANGCVTKAGDVYLREPASNDWKMNGNAGTDPATQYIGTSDNKDVVFRSNGVERFKLLSTGEVRATSLAGTGDRLLMSDGNGTLKILTGGGGTEYVEGCPAADRFPWLMCGNIVSPGQFLGSINSAHLSLRTNNETRIFISAIGKVGIGTTPPAGPIDQYRLFVEDGIVTRDVLVKLGTWPDFVFDDSYRLMPLKELRAFLREHRHLPGIPSAHELEAKDGFELGEMQRRVLQVVEEQALYILELEERLERMEQQLMALKRQNAEQ